MRWANAPTAKHLRQDLDVATTCAMQEADAAEALWLLSRSAQRKYQRIRTAVDLLGAALGTAALTAILTGLGW